MRNNQLIAAAMMLSAWIGMVGVAAAQDTPFLLLEDSLTEDTCDLVNAQNVEMVILENTGELVVVSSGTDWVVNGVVVESNFDVYYDNQYAGYIDFFTDGDGERTLWWVWLEDRAVHVDESTGAPTTSGDLPGDFFNVPCDACATGDWDDSSDCEPGGTTIINPGPVSISFCGNAAPVAFGMTMFGLMATAFVRRRRY